MFNFVYNLNRYGKNIILKNFLGSIRPLQDGSRIWDSQSAATPSKLEIRQILKQGSKIRGEYRLHKPVCAIVGREAWSTQTNQPERKMTGHAVVLIIQADYNGLEFIQFDPQCIKEAKVRKKVTDMAKEFKLNEVKLIPGSSDETSNGMRPGLLQVVGQLLDGKYKEGFNNTLSCTWNVSSGGYNTDSWEVMVAMK
jgi:hypothetical protein